MIFWARAGAAIGLFFHTLLRMHRAQTSFYQDERGRCWTYSCADCSKVLISVVRANPGSKINFGLKVGDEQIIKQNKKEEQTAVKNDEAKQTTTPEETNGRDEGRNETIH